MTPKEGIAVMALALLAIGCASGVPRQAGLKAQAAVEVFDYAATARLALANPARRAGDADADTRRKAFETLVFAQVRTGDTVFEIEAGGGYWTEILASAVGPQGQLVMQNPEGFIAFVGDEIAARFVPGRLANVRRSLSLFDDFDAPDASADVATWIQGPHELFYAPEGKSLGDPARSFQEIARILKPGGSLLVVDHRALAGAPATTGNDLHRIDPVIIIRLAEAAGLVKEAQADFLTNPSDPRTASAFDPSVRGRTDQFVMRFRKPA